jgi:predicted Zn-dependent protease with MMP-like domain
MNEKRGPKSDAIDDDALAQVYDNLEAGDIAAARRAIDAFNKSHPGNPDVALVAAACDQAAGDEEGAVARLRDLIKAEPEWIEPVLTLASLLRARAESPAGLKEPLKLVTKALETAEDEEDFLDALVLKAGLEFEMDKADKAMETLEELPPIEVLAETPEIALDVIELYLQLGAEEEPEALADALLEKVKDSEVQADAWYAKGVLANMRDDEEQQKQAWTHVLELDTDAPGSDELMEQDEVIAVVEEALSDLPERAREMLSNVPILVADLPAATTVADGMDPRALGMFSGPSTLESSMLDTQPELRQIVIFRRNLNRVSADPESLREEIRVTLMHEIGHFFGMSEDELEAIGLS